MGSDISGSLQSSSGGDEEYGLRAAMMGNLRPVTIPPPQLQPQTQPCMFEARSLSGYTNVHQNLGWPGSGSLRYDPDCNHMLLSNSTDLAPSFKPQSPVMDFTTPTAVRNPKKRSRASRRAPTTVLTTDTTNFRAMVQEFTGIPAQPFINSSFPRSRFDLYGTVGAGNNRRNFTHKFQSPATPLVPTSSLSFSNYSSSSCSTNLVNFKQPINQNPNLSNVQYPLLNSLIQSQNPKFIFSNFSSAAIESNGLDEFGFSIERSDPLHSLISTDQIEQRPYQMFPINGATKEAENIATGEEGTLEPWICSSE